MLGLGSTIKKQALVKPDIITDNLVMRHNYNANSNVPVSDGAAYFDGNQDKIDMTDGLSTPTGAFSMGCWFKILTGQLEERPTLIGRVTWSGSHSEGALIRFDTDSSASDTTALKCSIGTGSASTSVSFNTVPTRDIWNHCMVTVDGEATGSKTMKYYLNGILDRTTTSTHYSADDNAGTSFMIGKADNLNAGDSELKGYICNAGMWSRVLTQAEIKSIMWKNYADLIDSEKTSLVSWWNLSADANDSHGSNNGTLS